MLLSESHMRKKPGLHKVGRHKRNGKWVEEFPRGRGESNRKKTVVHKKVFNEDSKMGTHAWTVNFDYPGMKPPGETVLVFSDTYDGVLDEAFDERLYKHWEPYATQMIDPTIGQVLSAVGKGVKKVSGLGAKYAITGLRKAGRVGVAAGSAVGKGAIAVARESGKYASFRVKSRLVEQLLKDVYGPPGLRRTAAKIQLQTQYPEIWDMTSLSHDRPPRDKARRKTAKKVVKKKKPKKVSKKRKQRSQTIQIKVIP